MANQNLTSALETLKRREDAHLLEGIRLPDENMEGRVLIAVSSTEYFSVLEDDIVEESTPKDKPHRVWVKKGALVWRSKLAPLEKHRASARPAAPFAAFDELSGFAPAAQALASGGGVAACLSSKGYDLTSPLSDIFGPLGDDLLASAIYGSPAQPCLGTKTRIEKALEKNPKNLAELIKALP